MKCSHSDRIMIDKTGVCGKCGKLVYDDAYFLHGEKNGLSLYSDYRWLESLTIPMCRAIIDYLCICLGETVLDFGCARGYVVKAMRMLKIEAWGIDVSEWAIENADKETRKYLYRLDYENTRNPSIPKDCYNPLYAPDWVIAKDVLEHVPLAANVIDRLMESARIGVFVVVPLSTARGEPYVVPDYEKDVTHVHRMTLIDWAFLFARPGWSVELSYRVPGVKDNYYRPGWEKGNGFIVCRRIKE